MLSAKQVEERRARLEAAWRDRQLARAREQYQKDLEYANEQVEQGYWKKGKFARGIHPKTGEEQWELTQRSGRLTIKYVVDRWSRKPSAEDITYFYSEKKTIVDTPNFRLIIVCLEPPFPEDRPTEPEEPTDVASQTEVSSESLQEALEKLKKKMGR